MRRMAKQQMKRATSERQLSRAGLWFSAPAQLQLPFEARGLSNVVLSTGQLQLTPDYDVLAWWCSRWLRQPTASGWMRPTLYEIGRDLYGREPSNTDYATLRGSLSRLGSVAVTLYGYSAMDQRPDPGWNSLSHLMEVSWPSKWIPDRRFGVKLSDWLRTGIEGDQAIRLDWRILRRFHRNEHLAKRLWIYLAAEQYKRTGWPKSERTDLEYEGAWLKEGDWLAASLGSSYNHPAGFRRRLDRACEVIQQTDDRWLAGTLRLERQRDGRTTQARIYAERPTRESWLRVKGEYEASRQAREQARKSLRETS